MVSDKELLVQAIEKYVTGTASSLFGISSMPAQALIRYAVRNAAEKYGKVLDLFVDKMVKLILTLCLMRYMLSLKREMDSLL